MKNIKAQKREEVFNNYVNGNLSDFRDGVRKFKKAQIVDLIQYFFYKNYFLNERELFLARLYEALI